MRRGSRLNDSRGRYQRPNGFKRRIESGQRVHQDGGPAHPYMIEFEAFCAMDCQKADCIRGA
jgi:hypothetical protein